MFLPLDDPVILRVLNKDKDTTRPQKRKSVPEIEEEATSADELPQARSPSPMHHESQPQPEREPITTAFAKSISPESSNSEQSIDRGLDLDGAFWPGSTGTMTQIQRQSKPEDHLNVLGGWNIDWPGDMLSPGIPRFPWHDDTPLDFNFNFTLHSATTQALSTDIRTKLEETMLIYLAGKLNLDSSPKTLEVENGHGAQLIKTHLAQETPGPSEAVRNRLLTDASMVCVSLMCRYAGLKKYVCSVGADGPMVRVF